MPHGLHVRALAGLDRPPARTSSITWSMPSTNASQRDNSMASGTRATGQASRPSGSRRTASLSVVSAPQALCASTSRATRVEIARR